MIGIGFPNLVTESTAVSGGAWMTALPLSNIRTRDLSRVARSLDATTGSTKFTLDHGSALTARALVLIGCNASAAATVRWQRGTTSGGGEVADSGVVAAWAITPAVNSPRSHNIIVLLPAASSARYDTVSIADAANADGYVEVAHAYVCALQVPSVNADYGLQYGLTPMGKAERSQAGALWANAQRTLRSVSMVLEWSPLAEADEWHEKLRCASVTEPVLFLPSLTSRADQQRYGFVGVFSELSPIEYPYFGARRVPMKLTEL